MCNIWHVRPSKVQCEVKSRVLGMCVCILSVHFIDRSCFKSGIKTLPHLQFVLLLFGYSREVGRSLKAPGKFLKMIEWGALNRLGQLS